MIRIKKNKTMKFFVAVLVFTTMCFIQNVNSQPIDPPVEVDTEDYDEEINLKIKENYIEPLQKFAEQLNITAMQQVQIIGTFFDAKQQLENQRDMQALKAEAVKDYHPSDQMCRIGSYMRSVAASDEKNSHDHLAMNDIFMDAATNYRNGVSQSGAQGYATFRLKQFTETYCDPNDHDGDLEILCLNINDPTDDSDDILGAEDLKRRNNDINYQRTIGLTSTLDIDFTNDSETEAEEDVIAMARNLYWPEAFGDFNSNDALNISNEVQRARKLIAMANLAHNTFAKQVSMKAASPAPLDPATNPNAPKPGWTYMKTMMREFGLSDEEINEMVGENPSYNAQMEMLTKKMTQSPDFYTNLYDKPANVDRIQTSLQAISIMQQRDMHEAMMRREMLLSGLVEAELVRDAEAVEGTILNSQQ